MALMAMMFPGSVLLYGGSLIVGGLVGAVRGAAGAMMQAGRAIGSNIVAGAKKTMQGARGLGQAISNSATELYFPGGRPKSPPRDSKWVPMNHD